jgi:putative sulfotransferase
MSSMVRAHPDTLSVSELFSSLRDHDLSQRDLSGTDFWAMLSTPGLTDLVGMRCQLNPDELLYPAFAPRPGASRFNPATGVPPLIQVTIPHLTQSPDNMYDMIGRMAVKQPQRLLSEHFRWLFDVLRQNRRPRVIVERSGGSLAQVSTLMQLFPEARVVHLFRDGRECAVSMSRHARYKFAAIRAALGAQLGYDPYAATYTNAQDLRCAEPAPGALDAELAGLTPERITRSTYDAFDVPATRYGVMWSKMIANGVGDLPNQDRLLSLDYGDLVARPRENIARFTEFLGLRADSEWKDHVTALIRPGRDVRAEIGEQQWDKLTSACRLGMNRLYGRHCWI